MATRRSIVIQTASAMLIAALSTAPQAALGATRGETSPAPLTAGGSPSPVAAPVPGGWLLMERFGQAPDGSTTEFDFHRRQLWLVRPDGSDLHELFPGEPAEGKTSPDVAPDGSRIAFATWDPLVRVHEVSLDGGDPVLISTDCSGDEAECAEYDPAYSPDGTKLAVVRLEVDAGATSTWLAIRDLATGERTDLESTRVPWDAGGDGDGYLAQPSWSPDGSRIAYHRTPYSDEDYPLGITGWIVDVAGGDPAPLSTSDGEDAADLDWSPDGSRILYSTIGSREFEGVSTPPARIVSIGPDGSDPLVLCDASRSGDDGCWAPTWMPDGRQILFFGNRTWNLVGADGTGNAPIDAAHLTWFGMEPGEGFGYIATWVPDR